MLSGYNYRKTLTIHASDVDSDVTDFHYLVYLDSSNFNFSKAQSNGYDIRFTSSDGNTLLNFFREKHDSTNQVAIYHVKIPLVSSSNDTTIYMYYGNDSAGDGASAYADVFNNQVAYYPFDGNANDLSGNYNGTWSGTEQYDTGVLGQSAKMVNSSVYMDKSVSSYQHKTISIWYKEYDTSSKYSGIYEEGITTSSPWNGIMIWSGYNNSNLVFRTKGGNEVSICPLSDLTDKFHHILVTYDMSSAKFYLDNVLKSTISDTTDLSNLVQYVVLGGNFSDYTNSPQLQKNGRFDQIRIYNTALSSTQVSLLYKMENRTLFTFGVDEYIHYHIFPYGWEYYAKVPIDNTSNSSALTDYQVKINLTSANFDFTKAKSDGSDIRFTDSDKRTLLNYWIENYDSSGQTATIWVKVPSIDANSTKDIYLYCGNDTAVSASDGDSVFEFFDDFEGSIKWILDGTASTSNTYSRDGTYSVKLPQGTGTPTSRIYRNFILPSSGHYITERYVFFTTDTCAHLNVFTSDGGTSWVGAHIAAGQIGNSANSGHLMWYDTDWNDSGYIFPTNTWLKLTTIIDIDNSKFDVLVDNVVKITNADYINPMSGGSSVYEQSSQWGDNISPFYIDTTLTRQYTSLEPSTSVESLQTIGNTIWFGTNF